MKVNLLISQRPGQKNNEQFRHLIYEKCPSISFTGQGRDNNRFIEYVLTGPAEEMLLMLYEVGKAQIKFDHLNVIEK